MRNIEHRYFTSMYIYEIKFENKHYYGTAPPVQTYVGGGPKQSLNWRLHVQLEDDWCLGSSTQASRQSGVGSNSQ